MMLVRIVFSSSPQTIFTLSQDVGTFYLLNFHLKGLSKISVSLDTMRIHLDVI